MKKNKIGAGLLAGLCAFSMLGYLPMMPAQAAETTENPAFPSSDELIAQAATLLGTKYGFGKKGYSGIYYQGGYKPLDESMIRSQGIDCSGLIYYSLTHLGYSTSGFDWNNPVPVDTEHWLTVNDNCTITYGDVTSKIDIEKDRIKTTERPYWECADGSTIAPGSVVVAEIPNEINHSWIYLGEFENRDAVVSYLRNIGVSDSLINNKTVGDGSGDGGTHWRIESNGQEGVVVNNKTIGKKASALSMYAFRVTQSDVTFTITKVLSTDNNVRISGISPIDGTQAVYGVYADPACENKVGEILIGEDGTGSITLPNKVYYVKEVSAPTGYDLNPQVYELRANANVNVPEDITSGSIRINKTAEDGMISGREFQVSWTDAGNEHRITQKTDENGVAVFDSLPVYDLTAQNAITYTVSEVNVAERYVTPKAQELVLTEGDADLTVTADFENALKKGAIRINKQSEDFQNGDRHFVVTGGGNSYDIITGSDGIAMLTGIPVFDCNDAKIVYTISEKDVPIRYVIPADEEVTLTADATTDVTFENKLKKFTAEVTKTDAEKNHAQGDATLAGAVYGLYQGDELVASYTTDENGSFMTDAFPCGSYTLQEISPSAGYLLDETAYPVGAEPEHYSVENNSIPMGVTEEVVKGSVSIIKHSDDNEDEVQNMEQGAEFEIYLKSAGNYDAADESVRDYLTTDENGYAATKEMPYGIYTVHQTKTVNDAAFVADFDVQITEHHKIYEYVLNNAPFRSFLHVTKLDAETGKSIAYEGAGFQIYDASGNLVTMGVDTFYTNSEGYLITPETLHYGDYTLVEVQAPIGYVLDATPVPFSVTASNASEENAVNIVRVSKSDTAQKGRISVYKHGDVFQSVKAIAPPIWKDEDGKSVVPDYPTTYHPIFEDGGLSGAEFEITAAEDIVTADGTVRAHQGEIVATLVTDKDGYAASDLLYLGKYTVTEKKAPEGYVRNDEALTVELTYAGQNITVRDAVETGFHNAHQSVEITFAKFMEQDEVFDIGMNDEWRSVRFGLFAAERIIAADGTAIPENGFLAEVSLGKDMTATIAEQIPFGRYYVQEIATDEHYVLNGEKYLVNFEYMGQEMTTVQIDCGMFENTLKRGAVEGIKVNEHGDPLPGALFGLFKTGEEEFTEKTAILTDVSDENGQFSFIEIPYGEYVIREIKAPGGYVLSDEIFPVKISEDKQIVRIGAENDSIKVAFSKKTIYGDELVGAKMQVLNAKGKIVDEWVSDDTEHVVAEIPAGSYILHEAAAPDGYLVATDITFVIDEKGNVTVKHVEALAQTMDGTPLITMVDDTTIVKISKTDITTGEELAGASLCIIDVDGDVIEEWISGSEPHLIEAVLAAGKTYTLRETIAPDGYVLTTDITFTVNADGTVTEVEMADDTTKVRISKIDITNSKELPGASMQITDETGKIVDTWISGDTSHFIEGKLIAGKTYTLHEESAPDGYVVASDVQFTVNSDGSVTAVEMVDDTTKVKISKTDITTGEELAGASLQIVDEAGNAVDAWISTTEPHFIEGKLIAGKMYTLHEEIAPDGFVVATDVQFTVNPDGSVTEVEMVDDTTKVCISKTDLTTGEELPGASLCIIDENGAVIEEWISTNEPHLIEAVLVADKTYTLREVSAPDGYVVAEDVTFTVNADGTVTEVNMQDAVTEVRICKTDAASGEMLSGAMLQILDKDGVVVEEWASENDVHVIKGKLIAGQTYTLHEAEAPEGYDLAADITFTVKDDGSVTEVTMQDVKKPAPEMPATPPTGDRTNPLAYVLLVLGIAGLIVTILTNRRKGE